MNSSASSTHDVAVTRPSSVGMVPEKLLPFRSSSCEHVVPRGSEGGAQVWAQVEPCNHLRAREPPELRWDEPR